MSDLLPQTRAFALRCLKVADSLPRKPGAITIAHQLARSATSVVANYRASPKARSRAEFKAKLQIALEEAGESQFGLGLAAESGYLSAALLESPSQESRELTAILVSSLKTARQVK